MSIINFGMPMVNMVFALMPFGGVFVVATLIAVWFGTATATLKVAFLASLLLAITSGTYMLKRSEKKKLAKIESQKLGKRIFSKEHYLLTEDEKDLMLHRMFKNK